MPKTPDELRAAIRDLAARIDPLEEERRLLSRKLTDLVSPFAPGDIIEWMMGGAIKRMERGRVSDVCARTYDPEDMWWEVTLIRKDGTDGCTRFVHPWSKPALVSKGALNTQQG